MKTPRLVEAQRASLRLQSAHILFAGALSIALSNSACLAWTISSLGACMTLTHVQSLVVAAERRHSGGSTQMRSRARRTGIAPATPMA